MRQVNVFQTLKLLLINRGSSIEAYLGPCQTSKVRHFCFFAKFFIIDVGLGPKYTSNQVF